MDDVVMMIERADKSLWKEVVSGNKTAFEKLMHQYFRLLFSYGTKFSKDEELVKDTIQELFIRLWDRKVHLAAEVNPKAYLLASLRRALHRKAAAQDRFFSYDSLEDNINFFDFELSVEHAFIQKEGSVSLANEIAGKIATLPKRQKEVVYLKFFQEMSRDEISTAMGISPQTVSNLLQSALKKLRSELNRILLAFIALFSKKSCLSKSG